MESQPPRDELVTNPTLLLRLNSADPAPQALAWEEFHRRYGPIIAGFARKLGVKGHDIDDVIQDVMLGFYAQAPTFVYDRARGRFRGYLKVCTFRAMSRRVGRVARFRGVPIEQVDPEQLEVEQEWNDVWEQEQLKRAMEIVRQQYRGSRTFRAFEMTAVEGKPVPQVATDLGLSVDSVYKAKERITQALRERMTRLEGEVG